MTTGHDISKTRLDDLDREIIRTSLTEPFTKKVVCNFGCGESKLSEALVALGHTVHNYDSRNLEPRVPSNFTQVRLEELAYKDLPKKIDVAVFQRVLHYLAFADAAKVLGMVASRLGEGGLVYISLSGLNSALSEGYETAEVEVENRMGKLEELKQKEFNIEEPVCLYTEEDAKKLIALVPKLTIKTIRTSQFGNIKLVAQKVVTI